MKRLVLAVLALGLLVFTPAEARADDSVATIGSLAWLEGHWAGKADGMPFEATYSSPKGGAILSMSKSFVGEQIEFFEFEHIVQLRDSIVLAPYPNGKPAARFRLASHDASKQQAVFESPKNDFPRTITYRRTGDRLAIKLEGTQGGRPAAMEIDLALRVR